MDSATTNVTHQSNHSLILWEPVGNVSCKLDATGILAASLKGENDLLPPKAEIKKIHKARRRTLRRRLRRVLSKRKARLPAGQLGVQCSDPVKVEGTERRTPIFISSEPC